jgi:hypothetical protein
LFFQRTPEGKFRVSANSIGKRYEHKKLIAVKYGLAWQNVAIFPIEFEIKPIQVTLGSSVNPRPSRELTGSTAPLGASGVWWEAEVPLTREMKGETVEGQFDLEIEYGRPGKKRYSMIKKIKPTIKFLPSGDIEASEFTEVQ